MALGASWSGAARDSRRRCDGSAEQGTQGGTSTWRGPRALCLSPSGLERRGGSAVALQCGSAARAARRPGEAREGGGGAESGAGSVFLRLSERQLSRKICITGLQLFERDQLSRLL